MSNPRNNSGREQELYVNTVTARALLTKDTALAAQDWRPDQRSANENARNKLFMSGGPMITSGLRASVFVLAVQIYLSILQVNFLYNFVDCIVK